MNTLEELMSLKGRRALITGANGEIGHKLIEALAELGANLVLVDMPDSDYGAILSVLNEKWGVDVDCCDCDLESDTQRKSLIDQIHSDNKGLDILVNNAGFVGTSDLQGWVTDFESQSVETWRRALEVNLTAVFDLSRGMADLLAASSKGSIVNVASIYAVDGPDYSLYEGTGMGNPAAYGASKGGLLQLTRWLSTTMAPRVRVNAMSPGGVYRNQPESFVERYEKRTPLGRMATEDDFKGAIAFLTSDMSAYITGQNLMVDGGWTAW